ncbi:unnamed protein product [Didymodactylos carnosus]|uniref:Uncharacterized protein n=1 Tax=Didymodactylos carnosus TaxID=1234261 RepID=A0A814IL65_9BILA|nr:unnamed protein product [Didymodactylos carnosus]CAF1593948.1 unnamed protein product [Didymodactylos carnosus]CAF3796239.1 unnamed protein product [Didymodactylos carnosus]CAF4399068.1 unnamed protein product [Didymodactylos carnosus]
MCYKVSCPDCGKPTWKGCGNHIEQVLGDIPVSERCQCTNKLMASEAEAKKPLEAETIVKKPLESETTAKKPLDAEKEVKN